MPDEQNSNPTADAERAARAVGLMRRAAWVLIAGVVCWQFKVTLNNAWYSKDKPDRVSDFAAFYAAGTLALHGQDIYDYKSSGISRRPYLYPPTFAIVPMMALALLPFNAALVVYTLLNYALLFAMCWLLKDALWRLTGAAPPAKSELPAWKQFLLEPATGVMIAGIVCFRFIDGNIRQVNANLYVACALALALWLMLKNRTALRQFSSGVTIALATAIKVTPGLFGLYLLWSWRPWAMLGGAVGLVIFLVVLPVARFGVKDGVALLNKYSKHVVSAETAENAEEDPIGHAGGLEQKQLEGGISLRGTAMRYLTPRRMTLQYSKTEVRETYMNFVNLPETTARTIARIGELILLLITIALTVRSVVRKDAGAIALSFGLVAMTMLLISPLTRKAHLCVAMIPAAAMIALIQQGRIRGTARKICIAALAIICLEGAVLSVEFLGKYRSDWLQLALGFWYMLAVYAANAWALFAVQRENAGGTPAPQDQPKRPVM